MDQRPLFVFLSSAPLRDWQSTVGWGNCRIEPGTACLHSDVATNEPPLLPRSSDADDFIILRQKLFFGKLSCEKIKRSLPPRKRFFGKKAAKQKGFPLDDENCQHQHKGRPHTQEKSQDAATSMEDAITDTVHTSGVKTSCVCNC
jgi:hypothetical protein